jgi:ribosomal protein S27E
MTYNLVGKVFGDLTVIAQVDIVLRPKQKHYKVKCRCGNERIVYTNQITSSTKGLRSCGKCSMHITHKDAYTSWSAAKQRCFDTGHKDYERYGKRGITFDTRWLNFFNFLDDMGDPPIDMISGERMSLDRKDNNGNYTKDNCRWATRSEQQLNKGKLENGEESYIKEMI